MVKITQTRIAGVIGELFSPSLAAKNRLLDAAHDSLLPQRPPAPHAPP